MVNAIREARDARGWTSAKLNYEIRRAAAQLGLTTASPSSLRVMISQWENGRQKPDRTYQMLLCKAFDLPPAALGFENEPEDEPASPLGPLVQRGVSRLEISDHVLVYFRRQLAEHVELDNVAGPGLVIDVVDAQLAQLRRLASRGPIEVVELAARYAEFAGWLHQDSGNLNRALRYTDEAVDLADRAGDPALIAYCLMRKSNILTARGEQQRAEVTAQRAMVLAEREAPEQRAICLRQVALASAHLHDERSARDAIEHALELTASPAGDNELAAYCTTSYVQMEAALCLLVLGNPTAAAEACTRALTAWPAGLIRDQGLCLVRLALAQLNLQQIDDACASAMAAIELVQRAPSARALQTLRGLSRRMTPYREARSVRQFREALAAVA